MSLRQGYLTLFFASFAVFLNPAWGEDGKTISNIEARQGINVCIWPDYFSITYLSPRTQQLEGIDIDLSHALADDLGVPVNYVKTHFGRFMDDLETGKCDVAMFGVGNTKARQKRINFTQPYPASNKGVYTVSEIG